MPHFISVPMPKVNSDHWTTLVLDTDHMDTSSLDLVMKHNWVFVWNENSAHDAVVAVNSELTYGLNINTNDKVISVSHYPHS